MYRFNWSMLCVIPGLLAQAARGQVGLTISGNFNPTRGGTASYVVESNPPGLPIDQFNWTYSWSGGSNTYQDDDANADDKSVWSGRMVVDGTLSCSAVVSGTSVSASMPVTISPRLWTTPITCVEDNEPDWGSEPVANAQLGGNRDRDSDTLDVFVPRDLDGYWNSAFTLAQVPTGPCQGWWYVSSSTLKCQRETVINRYIKDDGPTLGGANFAESNTTLDCFTSSAADFLLAVMHHEYRGTPATAKSLEGHFGRIEKAILDDGHDAKKGIEPLTAGSQAALRVSVNNAITADDWAVADFGYNETYMTNYGPNWGIDAGSLGAGQSSRWNPDSSSWTGCVNVPINY